MRKIFQTVNELKRVKILPPVPIPPTGSVWRGDAGLCDAGLGGRAVDAITEETARIDGTAPEAESA